MSKKIIQQIDNSKLSFENNELTNLLEPINDNSAATKKYVDDKNIYLKSDILFDNQGNTDTTITLSPNVVNYNYLVMILDAIDPEVDDKRIQKFYYPLSEGASSWVEGNIWIRNTGEVFEVYNKFGASVYVSIKKVRGFGLKPNS